MKNIKSPDVYNKTVDDLIEHFQRFNFPCPEHKYEIFAYAIKYYLSMRMKQWSRTVNREIVKTNTKKKKLAKFCTT